MRLGDLDALKEAFLNKTHLTLFELLDLIDNAPTINPCEKCDLYFKAMTKEEQKGGAV